MAPRLSGQTSIFGVVYFVSKSPLGIERQKKLEKFAILTRKPRSHARILIYRRWPILDYDLQKYNEKFCRPIISCRAMTSILYTNSEKRFSRMRRKRHQETSSGTFSVRIFHVYIINK